MKEINNYQAEKFYYINKGFLWNDFRFELSDFIFKNLITIFILEYSVFSYNILIYVKKESLWEFSTNK